MEDHSTSWNAELLRLALLILVALLAWAAGRLIRRSM